MRRRLADVNWKAFAVLLAAGLLGVVAVFPFALELLGSSIPHAPDVSMPTVLAWAAVHDPGLYAATVLHETLSAKGKCYRSASPIRPKAHGTASI